MSGSVELEMRNTQLWWRSMEIRPNKDSSSLFYGDDVGNTPKSKEKVLRLVMGSLSIVGWLRSQWLLGLFLLSIVMAYYYPASTDMTASVWTRVLVIFSLILSGASFPSRDKGTTLRCVGPCITMCVMSFIVSPLMGIVVFMTFNSSGETNCLFVGLMCTLCLPPSAILSVAAVRSAQGNEALSQYLSAIGSVCGVIVSPLLMLLCISFTHSITFPGTTEIILFSATVIGAFFFGVVARKGLAWLSHSRTHVEDHDTSRLYKTGIAFSELSNGSFVDVGQRATTLNSLVLFLINYFILSFFFVHPVAPSLLTWQGVGLVVCIELVLYVVLCVISWLVVSSSVCTPEECIALFLALITKSEVLVIPIIFHLFHESGQAAVVLLPSLIYHIFQVIATGVLIFPLCRWRYHYNCRPGTTLLPLRLSKLSGSHFVKS